MPDALTVGSLFSGIGGLDLGLERAGMRVKWQCEIDPFCRAVLKHHWPDVTLYGDIRELTDAEPVDLICGGFPCQPVSFAGKGLAQEDPRWFWPEFARVVRLLRPTYVVVENVPGLVKRGLLDVLTDLAEMRFDAEWQIVSAASVGAPHLRERLFVVAYPNGSRLEGVYQARWDQYLQPASALGVQWETEPEVDRVVAGFPGKVAQLSALGNAVVPQVAEFVGRLIVGANAKESL